MRTQGCCVRRGNARWSANNSSRLKAALSWAAAGLSLFNHDKAGESGSPQMDFWESHFPFYLYFMSPGNITLLVWVLHWPTSSYKSWEGFKGFESSSCYCPQKSQPSLMVSFSLYLQTKPCVTHLPFYNWPGRNEDMHNGCVTMSLFIQMAFLWQKLSEWWMHFPLRTGSISWDASPDSFFSGHFSEHLDSCLIFLMSFDIQLRSTATLEVRGRSERGRGGNSQKQIKV